jgi:hypothetical protein
LARYAVLRSLKKPLLVATKTFFATLNSPREARM